MDEIKDLVPGVNVWMCADLKRADGRRSARLGDLKWRTGRQAGPTRHQLGQSPVARMELWARQIKTEQVELTAGVTPRAGWTLAEWVIEVRIRLDGQDRFTWPYAAGAVVPVRELAKAKRTLELTYPVYASMQWVDVFGAGHGVYVGVHDAEPYFKHLSVHAERQAGHQVLVIEFNYTDLKWPSDKQWACPPLVVARHAGDWREGSRIYRAWADTWFRHDPVPEFARRACGHNMISFPAGGGRVPFKELPRLASEARRLGIDGVHVADWMEEGFDTFYPAFKPDPTLGGEAALADAIRAMAAEGTWTCLYLNGRLLDPAGPHGEHAFDWAVKLAPGVKRRFAQMWKRTQDPSREGWKPQQAMTSPRAPFNRDGRAAQEWWGRVFAPVCPTVPGWRQLWLSRLSDLAATLRPAMFQVDQVCGCWSLPCYDENHPHRCPALAWAGYKSFTWAMRQRAKEVNPDAALWSEGVNDILGQAFDSLQMNLGFDALLAGLGTWDPRIFKYTFPEYVLLSGDLSGPDFSSLVWPLVVGGHCHFFLREPEKLDARTRRWIRFVMRMRTRHWRAFTSADVLVPDIEGDPGVKVMGYRDGRRLLLAGAPFEPAGSMDRAFEVELTLPDTYRRVVRGEWIVEPRHATAAVTNDRCVIKGHGPFVLVLQ